MQEDNKGLMPECKVLQDFLTNMINTVSHGADTDDYIKGIRDGLRRARDGIEESFNWSHRGGISGYVNSLDYDQLCRLLEIANEIKARKNEEEKLVVHRVVMYAGYTENFRQEQLNKAIDCYHKELLKVAKEEDGNIAAIKQVRLVHERVIASEYEEYFS
ncbi:hypothetical protein [Aeromonas sp. QDB22]|uniref:hypothetical protein n=1 Tax=Aeromonas sp. QDB22 TaxID=2989834 RepID=UPI0022DE9F6D|nr:hypothetical protein [Aeromonas sp. QDB22]